MTTQTELQSLREIAGNMGLKVGNIKNVQTIKDMIEDTRASAPSAVAPNKLADQELIRLNAMKLVRIRLTPMSPFERQLPCTSVDVGNHVIGAVKRTIEFNRPWHVEQMVLDHLRSRKFRSKREFKGANGRTQYENVFSPCYGIEIMDDLTADGLEELAADQRARHAID